MKIEKIKIKKFKALKDIEKEVKGKHIILMGENGVGKSSFIQFIELALGKTTNIPPNAEGEGVVITSKDGQEYTFSVKFKDGKPVITVIGPDGSRDTRKSYLSHLCGVNEFDIDEFVEMSKSTSGRKEQIEIFKSFLPTEVQEELQKYDNRAQTAYDERTEVSRKVKALEGAVKSNPLAGQTLSQFKPVDVASNMAELKAAQEHNSKVEKGKDFAETVASEIAEIESKLAEKKAAQKKTLDWLKDNQAKPTGALEEIINSATQANNDYQLAQSLSKQLDELEQLREEVGELTALVGSQKQAIADTITAMDSPVEGLMYNEEGLVYNGILVNPDSLSTSEIMELGVKLKMAENPELGILFLQRGESLGSKRLKEIIDLCNKNNFELILEEVKRGVETLQIELFSE
jgi:DNA repair exonuclease SbcCD ATPase subunit